MEPNATPDYATLPIEALLDALESAGRKPHPDLLQASLDRPAEVKPRLLEWLEAGSDEAWPEDDPRWYREIHAGHLLIAFREPAALPLFEAIFRDPEREDALSEWFITELPAYGPALTPMLLSLLREPGHEWAEVDAVALLGDVGRLHPEERPRIAPAVRALLPPLRDDGTPALDAAPEDVSDEDVSRWTWAVSTLIDLQDEESRPQVHALFDADLIDVTVFGDEEDYEQAMRGEKAWPAREPFGVLRYYETLWDGVSEGTDEEELDLLEELGEGGWQPGAPAAPVRVTHPPGRNAPCPCGSGRKYKHCCGRG